MVRTGAPSGRVIPISVFPARSFPDPTTVPSSSRTSTSVPAGRDLLLTATDAFLPGLSRWNTSRNRTSGSGVAVGGGVGEGVGVAVGTGEGVGSGVGKGVGSDVGSGVGGMVSVTA